VDRYFTVGERMYLHTTAAGKAILAEYPEERVDFIVDRTGLPRQTDRTITSREALKRELDGIRQRGYALNRGEDQEGVYAIGQVARKPSGAVLGAISVAGPTYRTKKRRFEERLTSTLDEHIGKLEARLR
jgi:DNA-binding IclR family transcriptional regulator